MKASSGHLEVFVNPGEFYFGAGDIRITTILGSCVSITLWHARHRHGGLCHFVLDSRGVASGHLDGKYADEAVALFMAELAKRATHPSEYQAKIFGGGDMFSTEKRKGRAAGDIGVRNIEAARHLMKRHGFSVVAENVGGFGHRRIMFDLWNGDVWMRFRETNNTEGGVL